MEISQESIHRLKHLFKKLFLPMPIYSFTLLNEEKCRQQETIDLCDDSNSFLNFVDFFLAVFNNL